MHFNSVLAVSATLFALGLAADPLAFTSWPKDVQAGKPVTLTWTGAAPDKPVLLTLRKGSAGDLSDVEVITAQAKNGAFTWTPGDNVKEGETYAFQVSQGDQRNYSALLKAGPQVPNASDKQTGTTATGTSATSATGATSTGTSMGTTSMDTTTEAPQTSATSSKPLISSAASGTPSSSPASSSVMSSTVTSEGPLMTEETKGKKAKSTAGVQNGASSLKYSMELISGALGLLVYLVQ